MDNTDVINAAVADPAVRRAQIGVGADGKPVVPSPAELAVRASEVLSSVIAGTLLDPTVARHIVEGEYELTFTTATEYTLPHYVGRIIAIFDSDNKPITYFQTKNQYREWRYRNWGGSATGSSPLVCYPIERNAQFDLKLGFFPGVTTGNTVYIQHVRRNVAPFMMQMLPSEAHPYARLLVKSEMSGSPQYAEQARKALMHLRRALRSAAGRHTQQYPRDIECAIRELNSDKPYTRASSTRYFGDG